MKKTQWIWLAIGVALVLVVLLSIVLFPGVLKNPGVLLALIGSAIVGVVATAQAIISIVKDIRDLDKPLVEPSTVTTVVIQRQPDRVKLGGFIPALTAPIYIHRGVIEQQIRQRLTEQDVVAIVGVHAPGGIGKTELAKRAATDLKEQFETVLWVDVGNKTPQHVIDELAVQSGISFPSNFTYKQQVIEIKRTLGLHHILVILDDVRVNNAANLVDFLPPSPPCAALITSRIQQFAFLPPNAVYTLDKMEDDQARSLLEAVLTPKRVEAEGEAVRQLMVRCQNNPLALTIAAMRIQQSVELPHPILAFTEKVQRNLAALHLGDEPRLNLFAVFDASYEELCKEDQQRFRRLAAFSVTGFSPEAATYIWEDDATEADLALARLYNLSLITNAAGSERYRLHDLLYEYAGLLLTQSGKEEEARAIQAEFLFKLFDGHYTDDLISAPDLIFDMDNLRKATEWARDQGDGSLLGLLATKPRNWLYNIFRNWDEWHFWLITALNLGIEDQGLRASVLHAIGDVQQFRKENDAALESYRQALELYKAVGDRLGEANIYMSQGDLFIGEREWTEAIINYEKALPLFIKIGSRLGQANTLIDLGKAYFETGYKDKGMGCVKEAAVIYTSIGMSSWVERANNRLNEMQTGEEKIEPE